MERGGTVYMLTNAHHTVIYIGVTSNLKARMLQHFNKSFPYSFSAKYNLDKLVYYENYSTITEAIVVEKKLKKRSRKYKEEFVATQNPEWLNLWAQVENW